MKHFLLFFLVLPLFSQAQKPFVKIAPTLFLLSDKNIGLYTKPAVKDQTVGGFVTGGIKVHKYIAAGITCGYLKPINFKASNISFNKPIIPIGFDFTFTNFESHKITPILQIQTMYPIHKQTFSATDAGGNDLGEGKVTGKIMLSAAGGISIPVMTDKKIFLTGGYSIMNLKNSISKESKSTGMILIAISFVI